jgi:hypothetical protein
VNIKENTFSVAKFNGDRGYGTNCLRKWKLGEIDRNEGWVGEGIGYRKVSVSGQGKGS